MHMLELNIRAEFLHNNNPKGKKPERGTLEWIKSMCELRDHKLVEEGSVRSSETINTKCWIWTKGTDSHGYPTFLTPASLIPFRLSSLVYATIYSWSLHNNAIPADRDEVISICGHIKCCNPEHLGIKAEV